ncbi:capsule biosynthesis protein CapG, partial [Streptococcus danieliae]|nr:capsule biosynthesis protein CapG [Streptococcus danieliae]
KKYKIICINDDLEMDARKSDKELEESFSKLFPNKSEFEL